MNKFIIHPILLILTSCGDKISIKVDEGKVFVKEFDQRICIEVQRRYSCKDSAGREYGEVIENLSAPKQETK